MSLNEQIIENIQHLAAERGIRSQPALQRFTGVPQTTLSGFMSQGKTPSLPTLECIATAFGVPIWQLLLPPKTFRALLSADCDRLLTAFAGADEDSRETILAVAEAQARYHND